MYGRAENVAIRASRLFRDSVYGIVAEYAPAEFFTAAATYTAAYRSVSEGFKNVRYAAMFPRDINRVTP